MTALEKINENITIINGDCRDILPDLEHADMVITSPPYNLGVDYDSHDDNMTRGEYALFAKDVVKNFRLKRGGRVCIEIGGSGRNMPLGYIWQTAAYEAGLGLFSEIGMQHRKTNPCAWGSYLKADACYTIPNFHMLYVFYKDTDRKKGKETTITKNEWVEWTRGWWRINWYENDKRIHPAQFPVQLPTRCMRLFGHKNDLVIDPFMGLGTTAIACHEQKRRFIGIEKSEKYYGMAKKRIKEKLMQLNLFEEIL